MFRRGLGILFFNTNLQGSRSSSTLQSHLRGRAVIIFYYLPVSDKSNYAGSAVVAVLRKYAVMRFSVRISTALEPLKSGLFLARRCETIFYNRWEKQKKRPLKSTVSGAAGAYFSDWFAKKNGVNKRRFFLVLRTGLEPTRLSPYAPQTYVSTNSTT